MKFSKSTLHFVLALATVLVITVCISCKTARILTDVAARNVKITTINLHNDRTWDARKSLIELAIRSSEANIVGLQEAPMSHVNYIAEQLGFSKYATSREGDEDETVGILYNSSIYERVDQGNFWFSDTPGEHGSKSVNICWGEMGIPRMVTWARFKRKNSDYYFYVYNTHLSSNGTAGSGKMARLRSAYLLAHMISVRTHPYDPVIVTGDFNTSPDSRPIQYLRKIDWLADVFEDDGILWAVDVAVLSSCGMDIGVGPIKLIDAYRQAHPGSSAGTKCPSGHRIDYVFVLDMSSTDIVRINSCEIIQPLGQDRICYSDHLAVTVDLTIPKLTGH